MNHAPQACTIWLTGLSGAGKSTIAAALGELIKKRGRNVEILDGDLLRTHLSSELGFSRGDRDTNIRRVGYLSHLLTRNGVFAIAAVISPFRQVRAENRALIGHFIEVYVNASLRTCIERDTKGLYKRALTGEIPLFTGVSDPYESPALPEVTCDTERETPAESAQKVLEAIEQLGYFQPPPPEIPSNGGAYSELEELLVKKRLEDLGYI
jgi:adenylylsulfate kinase